MHGAKQVAARCKGVYRIVRGNSEFVQAERGGGTYVRCRKRASTAIALIEQRTGEKPEGKPRQTWYSRGRQIKHFQAMMVIYADSKGEPILPSDLQTSSAMRRQYPSFYVGAPALQHIAFMAKHAPFKDALVARWDAIFLNSETEFIVHASACHMESLKSLSSSCPMTLRSFRRCNANDLLDSDLDCIILILQLVAF